MANDILTPTAVTREALRILHEKLTFIGSIKRDYDDTYKVAGAKRGDSLKIRLPNQYTVRSGATLVAQDTEETSVTLTTSTQKGVDVNFTSAELTLELDDFSERILEPAMAVLASDLENDALSMTKDVYNLVGTPGTTPASLLPYLQARTKLNQYLAPKNDRCLQMDSEASAVIVNALTGLFHDSTQVSKQYREGMMGRSAGYDWHENDRGYVHTNGADVAGAINDAGATIVTGATTIPVDGFTAALAEGSVFTIAGVNAVHPETKVAYNFLQQFTVVTGTTTTSLVLSPAIHSTGAKQNVDALPADNAVITAVGSAGVAYNHNLAYQKEAFAFTTADLVKPNGVDFCAREVYDGVSMRIVRDYDINNDKLPCRIDVLYGYKTLRPQLACRVTS